MAMQEREYIQRMNVTNVECGGKPVLPREHPQATIKVREDKTTEQLPISEQELNKHVQSRLLESMPVEIKGIEAQVKDIIDSKELFHIAIGAASRSMFDLYVASGIAKPEAIKIVDQTIDEIMAAREFYELSKDEQLTGHPDRRLIRVEGRKARAYVANFIHDQFGVPVLDHIRSNTENYRGQYANKPNEQEQIVSNPVEMEKGFEYTIPRRKAKSTVDSRFI
jgi:hypothetical protein